MTEEKDKAAESKPNPTEEKRTMADDLLREGAEIELDNTWALERAKFVSAAFDRASTAVVAVMVLTPTVGYWFKLSQFRMLTGTQLVEYFGACIVGFVALHFLGRNILKKGHIQ